MKKYIFILFVLTTSFTQAQLITNNESKPFIEVTGTATLEVMPDKIFIGITLSDKVINNQNYTIDAQERELKKALAEINIDPVNLYLSDASSAVVMNKKKEAGFKVTKEFTLQVKNAAEVSNVFKQLYAINIKEAVIQRAESSKIDSLRKEVRIAAIKAAKDKAHYLLAAIDEAAGKPLEIREQVNEPYFGNPLSNNMLQLKNREAEDNIAETNFQKFTISFSYYIKYAIK